MTKDKRLVHLDSTPPEGTTGKVSVATMEAVVENNPQPLKILKPYSQTGGCVPVFLQPEAQIVMHALFSCFERQKTVQEGLVGDLLWGFEQCGIPAGCSAVGLVELEKQGYVKFQTPDNAFINFQSTKIGEAWLRYQQKLLDMIYDK